MCPEPVEGRFDQLSAQRFTPGQQLDVPVTTHLGGKATWAS
jgi:hypothetical protein